MIKKLLLTLSFAALVAFASSGITYAWHDPADNEPLVVSEELHTLGTLYKEGIITEEEFKKAKSILLDPDSDKSAIKKIKKKKKKLTAVERKRLKEVEQEELQALKEQLRAEKSAERERVIGERNRILEERKAACSENPKSTECKTAKAQVSNILEKIRLLGHEAFESTKKEREEERQAIKERKERIKKERALAKQASLEEQERIRAEKAARTAERKRRKAEWKKACSDDSESKACKEGKPSEKIKNVLKKIKEDLGG